MPDGGEPDPVQPTDPEEPKPEPEEPKPKVKAFQPGFFQNLRASRKTDGRVTLRYRIPVVRSGARIQIVDAAGNDLSWNVSCVEVNGAGGNGGCEAVCDHRPRTPQEQHPALTA